MSGNLRKAKLNSNTPQKHMSKQTKIFISLLLIIIGVSGRLLPHLWNFTPVVAIALFAGVYLGRTYAWLLPTIVMLISDLFIGFYELEVMLVVYGSLIIVGALGRLIKKYKNIETITAASITASLIFFLATNWAVWQFTPWYAKTLDGLMYAYVMGLPFFRNALLGNLFYTFTLFGAYETIMFGAKKNTFLRLKLKWQMRLLE